MSDPNPSTEPQVTDQERFEGQLKAFTGRFEQYLLIFHKPGSDTVSWRSSNPEWALGAVKEYLIHRDESLRAEIRKSLEESS